MNYPEITKRLIAVRKEIQGEIPEVFANIAFDALKKFGKSVPFPDLKPLIPQEEYEQQNTWR